MGVRVRVALRCMDIVGVIEGDVDNEKEEVKTGIVEVSV